MFDLSVAKSNLHSDHSPNLIDAYLSKIILRRCLLLKQTSPDQWRLLSAMEAHNSIRKQIPGIWNHNQTVVVDRIRKQWGLTEFSEEEIHTVCGILEVNAFEVGQNGSRARATYSSAYLIAHDCTPNTTHTDQPETFQLTIRASTPIAKGDSFTLSYAYTLQGTMRRREHILESKFFSCRCARCKDKTEFNTYVSALRCPKCSRGYILSSDPLSSVALWGCCNCGYSVTARSVKLLMETINQELDKLDGNDVEGFEKFLEKYRNVLHPNHYLCISALHSLSQLYGKANGYLIQELSPKQLTRKQDICEQIMKVFDVLEPGLSRLRGITLYEWHAPLMIRATRDYEAKLLSTDELRTRLKKVVMCLRESEAILSLEPPKSPEHVMATAAQDALFRIKDWQKIIGKI